MYDFCKVWYEGQRIEFLKTIKEVVLRLILFIYIASEEILSVCFAAKKYGVPERTISWHLKKQQNGIDLKKTALKNVLTEVEEKQLVEWLDASSNFADPKDDLTEAASDVRKLRKSSDAPLFKNDLPTI